MDEKLAWEYLYFDGWEPYGHSVWSYCILLKEVKWKVEVATTTLALKEYSEIVRLLRFFVIVVLLIRGFRCLCTFLASLAMNWAPILHQWNESSVADMVKRASQPCWVSTSSLLTSNVLPIAQRVITCEPSLSWPVDIIVQTSSMSSSDMYVSASRQKLS